MKKIKTLRIFFWTMSVLICAFIFYMSSCDAVDSNTMSTGIKALMEKIFGNTLTDFFVRKLAHTLEYMALGFFLSGAVVFTFSKKPVNVLISVLICAAYASSDEIHQYFIPGRSCQVTDVLIDTLGAIGGTLIILLIMKIYENHKRKKAQKKIDK